MREVKVMSQGTIFHKRLVLLAVMVMVSVGLVCATAKAAVVYRLSPGSTYQEGCVAPCMCPVSMIGKIKGTFKLVQLTPTPLFTRYRVVKISWVVMNPNKEVVHMIRGHGIYQLGGETALMQQLILDLSIDGADPVFFDSGLVPVESAFPNISISVDRGTKCYDIWLDINARPK
jgi:hypothetical protein